LSVSVWLAVAKPFVGRLMPSVHLYIARARTMPWACSYVEQSEFQQRNDSKPKPNQRGKPPVPLASREVPMPHWHQTGSRGTIQKTCTWNISATLNSGFL